MDYEVKIKDFEGPMDLLLFFIQRDKLNIYDIPISHIAKEFLDYMKMMDVLNINLGGEFVYMASLLMKIKARILLPLEEENEEDQIEDPRTPLVHKLLEYQQYKKASEDLYSQYLNHSTRYAKGVEMNYKKQKNLDDNLIHDITLYNLTSIFQDLINRMPDVKPYEFQKEPIHLDDQINFLRKEMDSTKKIMFKNLVPNFKTRLHLIVTFLAILEMLRRNEIIVKQKQSFGDLVLLRYSKK